MSEIIVPNPDEIRPARPIPRKEIDQLIWMHRDLGRAMLDRAFEIGFKLRCWHDLIPHGRWLQWCEQNIAEISQRSIQVYLKLWDNNELIKQRIQKRSIAADLEDVPSVSIREALSYVPKKAPKEKRASRPIRDIQTATVPSHPDEAPEPATRLDESEVPDSSDNEESEDEVEVIPASELASRGNSSCLPPIQEETIEVRPSQLCRDCRKAVLANLGEAV